MTSQKTPNDILNESAKRILNGWNTRATPSADTLAGLDRYNKVYDYEVGSDRMMRSANGEYVLYSEAAAMLVEKDAEIESLREKYREAVRNAFKDSNYPISGK